MAVFGALSPCCSERIARANSAPLFGPEYRPLELSDRSILEPVLRAQPQPLAGFTFAGMFGWAEVFSYQWRMTSSGALFVSYIYPPDPHRHLVQPLGILSPDEEQWLVTQARRLDYPLQIQAVSEDFLETHPTLVAACSVEEDRARFDYMYDAQDLALLKGRKYARKRNHLAQAERSHVWRVESLSPVNLDICRQIQRSARVEFSDPDSLSLAQEHQALTRTLDHALALEQQGLVLFADNVPAGFSIFEAQAPGVAIVHFERALRAFTGSFQMINRETARVLVSQGFTRINREDDLGIPGLRMAKLSYYPRDLIKSFRLTLKKS